MLQDVVRPRGPYRLPRQHVRPPRPRGGAAGRPAGRGVRTDGLVRLRAPDEESLLLRFMLALDADVDRLHAADFRRDRLGPSIRGLHGLRPPPGDGRARSFAPDLRAADRGATGARDRARCPPRLRRPGAGPTPRSRALAGRAPPPRARDLARLDLVRLCRSLDLEALQARPVDAVAPRLLAAASALGRSA